MGKRVDYYLLAVIREEKEKAFIGTFCILNYAFFTKSLRRTPRAARAQDIFTVAPHSTAVPPYTVHTARSGCVCPSGVRIFNGQKYTYIVSNIYPQIVYYRKKI